MHADSSAALAIAKRKGAGKLRHISINCLWIHEKVDEKQLELRKGLGTKNPADMMTKHLARQPLDGCMVPLNQHLVVGRAQAGLNIQGGQKSSQDNTREQVAEPIPAPSSGAGGANDKQDPAPSGGPCKAYGPRLGCLIPVNRDGNDTAIIIETANSMQRPAGGRDARAALLHVFRDMAHSGGDAGGGSPQSRSRKDKKPRRRAGSQRRVAAQEDQPQGASSRRRGGGDLGPDPQAKPRVGGKAIGRRIINSSSKFLSESRVGLGRKPQKP